MGGHVRYFDTGISPAGFAAAVAGFAISLGLAYCLIIVIYNAFFHPLSAYRGPRLSAISHIPYARMHISGQPHRRILELHMKYGPIVRIAPNILAYNHPNAMKEIRGHRKSGQPEHGKDPLRHKSNWNNIIGADRPNHTRFRRALASGFSHQAMLDQQSIVQQYTDTLFQQLAEKAAGGTKELDMTKWYNYTTFDIIGDLTFGESFGCLESSTYHPWVEIIFDTIKYRLYQSTIDRFPLVSSLLSKFIIPRDLKAKLYTYSKFSVAKVRKRLDTMTDRKDFMTAMTAKKDAGDALSFRELNSHARTLINAGSETTATALSAATYFLSQNPEPLAKLTAEVRSAFSSEEEIDLLSVQHLSYMLAVLDEALRLYPPAPGGQPRVIAKGGDIILDRYVPEGTMVEVWQWSSYHHPDHFKQPEEFIPERWLGDPLFKNDKKDVFQPFSVGPRNCIGRKYVKSTLLPQHVYYFYTTNFGPHPPYYSLAYAEMRLILAKLVWKFDIKPAEGTKGWDDRSKIYLLWEKGPLNIYLKSRAIEV